MKKALGLACFSMSLCLGISVAAAQNSDFHEIPTSITPFAYPGAYSITNSGSYLLLITSNFTGPGSAFVFDGFHLLTVPVNAGDEIFGLNGLGYFCGEGNNGSFLQDPTGKQTFVTSPDGDSVFANNLNNSNVVVGFANTQNRSYGFLWQNGNFQPYNYPPDTTQTYINGISNHGDFVGTVNNDAFINTHGVQKTFTVPGIVNLVPNAVNNSDLIVGYLQTPSNALVGFVRNARGTTRTYNFTASAPKAFPGPKSPMILDPLAGGTLFYGVNDRGIVCGVWSGAYTDLAVDFGISLAISGYTGL